MRIRWDENEIKAVVAGALEAKKRGVHLLLELIREGQKKLPIERRRQINTVSAVSHRVLEGIRTNGKSLEEFSLSPAPEPVVPRCNLTGTETCPRIPKPAELLIEVFTDVLVNAARRLLEDPKIQALFRQPEVTIAEAVAREQVKTVTPPKPQGNGASKPLVLIVGAKPHQRPPLEAKFEKLRLRFIHAGDHPPVNVIAEKIDGVQKAILLIDLVNRETRRLVEEKLQGKVIRMRGETTSLEAALSEISRAA